MNKVIYEIDFFSEENLKMSFYLMTETEQKRILWKHWNIIRRFRNGLLSCVWKTITLQTWHAAIKSDSQLLVLKADDKGIFKKIDM